MRWARRTGRRERAKFAEESRAFSERGGRPSLECLLETGLLLEGKDVGTAKGDLLD